MLMMFIIVILVVVLLCVLVSPFSYPLFYHSFDVTTISNPDITDILAEYFDTVGRKDVKNYLIRVDLWTDWANFTVEHSPLKRYRLWQYKSALSSVDRPFIFVLEHVERRGGPDNAPYTMRRTIGKYRFSYDELAARYEISEETYTSPGGDNDGGI